MSEKLYTQEELDAAVAEAVKFVNECNQRQAETIKDLREKIQKAFDSLSEKQ